MSRKKEVVIGAVGSWRPTHKQFFIPWRASDPDNAEPRAKEKAKWTVFFLPDNIRRLYTLVEFSKYL